MDQSDFDISKVIDTSYPLLEKMREQAPGTYKHSVAVSNMCETIAIELDLDKEVMKCVGMFHDIGKLIAPTYFSENQLDDENPHDKIDPYTSFLILSRHVSDSVNILFSEKFPGKIIQIISQHHGDTILQGAAMRSSRKDLIDRFRYKTNKPQSTEAAILMIVDSVEATARATYNNDEKNNNFSSSVINKTINKLVDDGQLDNLKIGILKVIKSVLNKELDSTYHKRVVYDTLEEEQDKSDDEFGTDT